MTAPGSSRIAAFSVAVALLALAAAPRAGAQSSDGWIITPEEAARPDAKPEKPPALRLRGRGTSEGPGPKLEMISPPEGQPVPSPVNLYVKFTPNQAPVDLATLKVKLIKIVKIDITDRLKPYATPEGIHIPEGKFPSGRFRVRVQLADVNGNISEGEGEIVVQ